MNGRKLWDVVIVGAGIAGLSTALWARRVGLTAAVLERENREGGTLLRITGPIVDYPGWTPSAGAEMAMSLLQQVTRAGVDLLTGVAVNQVDAAARTCETSRGRVAGRALVLATGLSPRRLGVPGEEWVTDRRPSQEPDWFRSRRVAVVGGGDRAAENALLLEAVAGQVWLIHRRDTLRARREFQERLAASRVQVLTGTAPERIEPVGGDLLLHLQGRAPLAVDAVCAYIGNRANTDLVAGQVALTPDGYLDVDRNGQTSAPGVYAVGDVCTPPEYQSLANASGQAMVVAKHIALSLDRNERPADG